MFIVCNSVDNSTGDDSAANFEVLFNTPLVLKDDKLELVSCVLKKETEIVVSSAFNSLVFRLGEEFYADQYVARIPVGNYQGVDLAPVIAKALNDATPVPCLRRWKCVFASGAFTISHGGLIAAPTPNVEVLEDEETPLHGDFPFQNFIDPTTNMMTYEGPEMFGPQPGPETPLELDFCIDVHKNGELSVRDIASPNLSYTTFEKSVHPNDGFVELMVQNLSCYTSSIIDGGFGTTEAVNRYKMYHRDDCPLKFDASRTNGIRFQKVVTDATRFGTYGSHYLMFMPISNAEIVSGNFQKEQDIYKVVIYGCGVMQVDLTKLAPDGTRIMDVPSPQFEYFQANTDWKDVNDLRIGRWTSYLADANGEKSYLYTCDNPLIYGESDEPPTAAQTAKYRVGSTGFFNARGLSGVIPRNTPEIFYSTAAQYKILEVDSNKRITKFCLLNAGEGYEVGQRLFFDDRSTLLTKVSDANVAANCAYIDITSAMLGTKFKQLSGSAFYNGFVMRSRDIKPYSVVGLTRNEWIDADINTPQNQYFGDIAIIIKPNLIQGSSVDFLVDVVQNLENPDGSLSQNVLFENASYDTWNTELPSAPANWTQYSAGDQVRVSIEISEMYNFNIYIEHTLFLGGFAEKVLLCTTGDVFTNGNTFMQSTKQRLLPYRPILKLLPNSFNRPANHFYQGTFEDLDGYQTESIFGAPNYRVGPIITESHVVSPNPVVNATLPRIMLKTKPLSVTNINPTPAAVDEVTENDFVPEDVATAGILLNLHSAYFCAQGGSGTARTFAPLGPANILHVLPSFTVELANLPLKGLCSKNFDQGDIQQGTGAEYPILHIVNGSDLSQTIENSTNVEVYEYKAQFSMPVQVHLETEQSFYRLQVKLRNSVTGELLKDLLHPTSIVLRKL